MGYKLAINNGYRFDESLCLIALADIFNEEKKYDKALEYYLMARQRGEKVYSLEQEAEINIGTGSVYVNKGNIKLGIDYLLKGYQIAKDINFLAPIPDATKNLATAYLALNDYKNAYKYKEINAIYKDSIYSSETNKRIAENQFNYELEKKQSKIELLEKDKSIKEEETKRQDILDQKQEQTEKLENKMKQLSKIRIAASVASTKSKETQKKTTTFARRSTQTTQTTATNGII